MHRTFTRGDRNFRVIDGRDAAAALLSLPFFL
jgi:hypothetical protein